MAEEVDIPVHLFHFQIRARRRVGKTSLVRMVPDVVYLNCDLPSTRRALDDPELFLESRKPGTSLAFDGVHRIADPSLLLKNAADEYPELRILATGSSTLAATGKFRDSLTGRKRAIYLCPVLWEECEEPFGIADLDRRRLHGGLPESLLRRRKSPHAFAEWIDSFYARDILELFSVRNRQGFLSLFRLLLRWSAGQVDYSRLSRLTELSRPTVKSYLEALEIAHAVHLYAPSGVEEVAKSSAGRSATRSIRVSSPSRRGGPASAKTTAGCSGSIWCWTPSGSGTSTRTSSTGVTRRDERSTSWFGGRRAWWTRSSAGSIRMRSTFER